MAARQEERAVEGGPRALRPDEQEGNVGTEWRADDSRCGSEWTRKRREGLGSGAAEVRRAAEERRELRGLESFDQSSRLDLYEEITLTLQLPACGLKSNLKSPTTVISE
ncbi:uncharacterized protein A4U43_C04F33450 [Asparagus officinalis]|uniref:Uncharacterized protein n=1 Tax=Asparagus officinalis TaxID=4686 RepID=A0A5P1F7A9_ASPOF|nr:uncharacterized protein A4U43_C04F33450 [Asparagus officinalis]